MMVSPPHLLAYFKPGPEMCGHVATVSSLVVWVVFSVSEGGV